MNDKISIIVPIYNVERFIRQCINSIIHQTYQNLEILLIDDGSPDNCGDICDEYAGDDSRIIVIHKENAGVSVARNIGIEQAGGEWIMFVDPDDWLELDCCERVIQVAQKYNCDVVYFQRDERDDKGLLTKTYPRRPDGQISEKELEAIQLSICMGDACSAGFESATPWGKLYRHCFIMKNKCRFPIGIKKRQDVIFNLICFKYLKEAYYFDYVGYHYRRNPGSICLKFNTDIFCILTDFLKELNRFIKENIGCDLKYEKAFAKYILVCLREIENIYCFHSATYIPFLIYERKMDYFFRVVNADFYLNKCSWFDMSTVGERISFYLLSRHHWRVYYCLKYIKRKIIGQ